ncbi:MAG: hypothetical protein SLRJCFUN_000559 [Candidatus Fervidibacter sp.]
MGNPTPPFVFAEKPTIHPTSVGPAISRDNGNGGVRCNERGLFRRDFPNILACH